LQAAVNNADGTAKPGLEFKDDTKYRLTPIPEGGYATPAEGATILNYYNTSRKQDGEAEFYYLEDVNLSLGAFSTAAGQLTQSIGAQSFAEGLRTHAVGANSHSEGSVIHTKGAGDYYNMLRVSDSDYAEGKTTFKVENNAFNTILNFVDETIGQGKGIDFLKKCSVGIVCKDPTTQRDIYLILPIVNITGGALDATRSIITQYADDTFHNYRGYIYLCMGGAFGENSHSEGFTTIAKGSNSHTEGKMTISDNDGAHAEGGFTIASGQYAHAEGYFTEATKAQAHAEGSKCQAIGVNAHAEGYDTEASYIAPTDQSAGPGEASHAEGVSTRATGRGSHAEGVSTKASNVGAHAEGCAVLEGNDGSQATGRGSHAEGGSCTAYGAYSHAEGDETYAGHHAAHTSGYRTKSSADY
jgi:hypothetical protein